MIDMIGQRQYGWMGGPLIIHSCIECMDFSLSIIPIISIN